MMSHETNVATKTPDLASVTPLITAVVTAVGAWKLFEPKMGRIRAIREELGRMETSFRVLYEFPQWLLISASTLIVAVLVIAFFDSFLPGVLTKFLPLIWAREIVQPANVIWVVFLMAALGGIIYWNLLTRILLVSSRLLALLPVPGLRNQFGPSGRSIGWHQVANVCEGPDKGSPLLVDHDQIDRVSWEVLAKLSSQSTNPPNYAAEPGGLSASEKANIALFGCIMEENTYAQRWPSPEWGKFYDSFTDIQKAEPIFTPSRLSAFSSGDAFFDDFRQRLDTALTAKGQPCPPNQSLAAAADVAKAWSLLKCKYHGDVLRIIPIWAPILGGKLFWLDLRLRSFPRLNSDGMRPQLLKLLIRWNTMPGVEGGVFVQPFAKRQAWLLLQEGALRALPETKEVTFHGTGQVGIARIAARQVVQEVSKLIAAGKTSEARAAAAKVGTSTWRREAAVDFVLWDWAGSDSKAAKSENWDKAKWRWKFEDNRVVRQG
jgi:hypothetical protein